MPSRCYGVNSAVLTERSTLLARYPLLANHDVVRARQAVARELKERGLSTIRITRFSTAVSEIARNVIVHGGGGEISLHLDMEEGYLITVAKDQGQGIADIDQAMVDGYTTAGGLGRGLGGAKRLSDRFEIETGPGQGTVISMSVKL